MRTAELIVPGYNRSAHAHHPSSSTSGPPSQGSQESLSCVLGSSVRSRAAESRLWPCVSGGVGKSVPQSIAPSLGSPAPRRDERLCKLLIVVFLVGERFPTLRRFWGSGLVPPVCLYSSGHSSCATLIIFHVEFVSCQQKRVQVSMRSETKIAPFPRRALWLHKMAKNPQQREGQRHRLAGKVIPP